MYNISKVEKIGKCTNNQTIAGCGFYPGAPSKILNKWRSNLNPTFCAVRASDLTYEKMYENIESIGKCNSGFKNCGNTSPVSIFCVPSN